jgi:hypothetical protein
MPKGSVSRFVPLLAVVAFAATATAAQATVPHWYRCEAVAGGTFGAGCTAAGSGFNKVLIGPSPGIAVKTEGEFIFKEAVNGTSVECKVLDEGRIWNPTGGTAGEDSITSIKLGCSNRNGCSAPELTPMDLPWKSILVAGSPIKDKISGIEIEEQCSGTLRAEFSGHLTPEFVNGKPSFAKFTSSTGTLSSTLGNAVEVTGEDEFEGPSGEVVLAE